MDKFLTGRTPFFSCQADPRFSYCLFVPPHYDGICVYVHGTERDAALYRDLLTDFAHGYRCIILSPLFPAGLLAPDDLDNYKNLMGHDARYDLVLLSMVEEVMRRYKVQERRFLLGGFSGGAQFVHRFFYLHPGRLRAISVAAPGRVTLLDPLQEWWVGIKNIEQQFNIPVSIETMRTVPVHMVVGDVDNEEIPIARNSPYWMLGANSAGRSRLERLQSLRDSYERVNIPVQFETVSNVSHEVEPLLASTVRFFLQTLQNV